MSIHNRGLDGKRPVHPMCEGTGDVDKPCMCDWLWQGLQADQFPRAAEIERRRSMRRQSVPILGKGAHPDSDEAPEALADGDATALPSGEAEETYAESIQLSALELAGFWNRAEEYESSPVWHVEPDRIAAFNDIQAKWGSEFAHAWLSNVAHDYRLTRTHEQFCWLKSRDYL